MTSTDTQGISDEQIDELDKWYALHVMAPRGKKSVREFARAVLALASPPRAIPAEQRKAEQVPDVVKSAPARIYLDIGERLDLVHERFDQLEGVTWSEDNATGDGIPYVRADLA